MTTREDILSLAVPEGYWLAPIVPDVDMLAAGYANCRGQGNIAGVYEAMRKAAPTPPTAEAPGQEPAAAEPLKWKGSLEVSFLAAEALFGGRYVIDMYKGMTPPVKLETRGWYDGFGGMFNTVDEAKVAAQADCEQRIRSALVSAPPTYADAEAKGHWQRQAEAAQKNASLFQQDCALHVAEKTELRAALAPFTALSKRMLDKDIPRHVQDDESTPVLGSGLTYEDPDAVAVTVGDLRRAAAIRSLASPAPKGET